MHSGMKVAVNVLRTGYQLSGLQRNASAQATRLGTTFMNRQVQCNPPQHISMTVGTSFGGRASRAAALIPDININIARFDRISSGSEGAKQIRKREIVQQQANPLSTHVDARFGESKVLMKAKPIQEGSSLWEAKCFLERKLSQNLYNDSFTQSKESMLGRYNQNVVQMTRKHDKLSEEQQDIVYDLCRRLVSRRKGIRPGSFLDKSGAGKPISLSTKSLSHITDTKQAITNVQVGEEEGHTKQELSNSACNRNVGKRSLFPGKLSDNSVLAANKANLEKLLALHIEKNQGDSVITEKKKAKAVQFSEKVVIIDERAEQGANVETQESPMPSLIEEEAITFTARQQMVKAILQQQLQAKTHISTTTGIHMEQKKKSRALNDELPPNKSADVESEDIGLGDRLPVLPGKLANNGKLAERKAAIEKFFLQSVEQKQEVQGKATVHVSGGIVDEVSSQVQEYNMESEEDGVEDTRL